VVIEQDHDSVESPGPSFRVWTVRNDAFFDRDGLYQEQGKDYPDNLERFAWFSRAIVEVMVHLLREGWKADLLHLHDWQTALSAVYLKTIDQRRLEVQGTKTVLTLHNVGYQGIFPRSLLEKTGLPPSLFSPESLEFYGSLNLLKGGIIFADYLTTVSPTYAKEILTAEFGFGLEGVLRNRKSQLQGIINGIDTDLWNPESDPFLPARYSVDDRRGKQQCKHVLQEEFSLPKKEIPLLAVIARLTSQKGLDLIEQIIPQLMEMDVQLVILGTGDASHEANLKTLQVRYPERIGLHIGFDEALAHRIEGGADIFLMPSRYEPCGLSQLYSLRYRAVPIVTRTGGLIDTVIPFNPETMRADTATGFHVEAMTARALFEAVRVAVRTYDRAEVWNQLVQTGMKSDVSWARSAKSYDRLFASLIGK
jgi:starch synthase